MIKTCYITSDKSNLTHNLDSALKGRVSAGERNYVFVEEASRISELSFEDSLYERVANAILSGKEYGTYFLDGSFLGEGYVVGGSINSDDKNTELILDQECANKKEYVITALELLVSDIRLIKGENPQRRVAIGFWSVCGCVFISPGIYYALDEKEDAAKLAFHMHKEWAFYDIKNNVAIYSEEKLTNNIMSSEFVNFKSNSYEYRNGNKQKKIDMLARWYKYRKFECLA